MSATLAAYAIGLLAASSVRLFAAGFHAMLDTRTPVRYAAIALVIGGASGAALMWPLYAPGLAAGAALGSWSYLLMLWTGLERRVGALLEGTDLAYLLKLIGGVTAAGLAGLLVEALLAPPAAPAASPGERLGVTVGTLAAFGVVYLAAGWALRVLPPGGLKFWMDRAS